MGSRETGRCTNRDCSDEQTGANTHTRTHTLIWLPLFVGVGGTGASKKNMLLRACNFEVTLRSNSFRVCVLCECWNAYRIAVLLIAFLIGFAVRVNALQHMGGKRFIRKKDDSNSI